MMTLLDSPLNKSGHLQVFLQTKRRVLIQVNSEMRLPRTYARFEGLMIQLLSQLKIKASDGNATLMKVIKNPVTKYLPMGCMKVALVPGQNQVQSVMSYLTCQWLSSQKQENNSKTKKKLVTSPMAFVVGGFSSGKLNLLDSCDDTLTISNYELSASVVCSKICNAAEELWGIL